MRLPKVLDQLAEFGAHDRKTWEVFARALRDSGDLPRTKPGMGAAHITVEELATLVLAGLVTASPAKAAHAVRHYRKLPLRRAFEPPPLQLSAHLSAAFSQPTFGQALDVLIGAGRAIASDLR